MITDQQLIQLGFDRVMTDYWKKDNFGILRSWLPDMYGALIYFNTRMFTLEELAKEYLRVTGKELPEVADNS